MAEVSTSGERIEMLLNMGPQHPSTHGVFRMVLWVDGEKIVDSVPHIGYLHRGSEKLCEGEQYHQVTTLFDRLDYIANFNNEHVYCRAVEKLMGLEVPERAEYVRVILCELNRIASHLLFVATMGLDAGAMTPSMFCFRGRERIQGLFEAVSGARMMHNYFRVGGLKEDLPADFMERMRELMPLVREDVEESDRLLTFNEIFLARLKGISPISAEDAIDFGLTGPCLRASGVDYDVRRAGALFDLRSFRFRRPCRPRRRLLGPLLPKGPRDVRVDPHHRPSYGADARRKRGLVVGAPPHTPTGRGGLRAGRESSGRDRRVPHQ